MTDRRIGDPPAANADADAAVEDVVRLCAVDDLVSGEARRFDVAGHRICLVRIGDAFYAVGDRCSHADYSLSEGEVLAEDQEIECWKHGSAFSLLTGEPQSLPATKPVPVYQLSVSDGQVSVILSP